MDHFEVAEYWDENADRWTKLARAGCDVYRDWVNTPGFFDLLPEVKGLDGLDIGCGEGHNTRMLAGRGAKMTAIDISRRFIDHARGAENDEPLRIDYQTVSAHELPFADSSFDFATAFMSLMDLPDPGRAIREAQRVLRPGGFLQFSIGHPCFQTPRWRWVRDPRGENVAMECGEYFQQPQGLIDEWAFAHTHPKAPKQDRPFRVPRFYRTLSGWVNLLIEAGFALERLAEPFADDDAVRRYAGLADTRIVAYFLIIRCRKSG